MTIFKKIGALLCTALLLLLLAPMTLADVWNKKTIMTINQPLRIPGKVLPPGKYVFRVLDSSTNRHIVRILNEDENQVYATIVSIPNYRLKPADKAEFGFWEMPKGSPLALRSWFYPGENFGHEFPYPQTAAREIATAMNQTVPSVPDSLESKLTETPATTTTPASEELKTAAISEEKPGTQAASSAAATAPPSTSTTSTAATTPATSESPKQVAQALPRTASPFSVIGLVGLVSAGAAWLVRRTRARIS